MRGSGVDPAASCDARADERGAVDVDAREAPPARSAAAGHGVSAYWLAVDLDVSAVIGQRGTAAVLRRALFVTRRTHGWMPEAAGDTGFEACLRALGDVLAGRTTAESEAGCRELEAAFHDLLESLVGSALTSQLLRAARAARLRPGDPLP